MEANSVHIDFSLPHTPESINFIKLSQSDRLRVVTLGMKFLALGNQQVQIWDNNQWEARIDAIKGQKQKTIDNLHEKLHQASAKIEKLVQAQKEEISTMVEGVRSRVKSRYEAEIVELTSVMERLKENISNHEEQKGQLYQSIYEEFERKILSKENRWEEKLEKQREHYEQKLERERERTAACILTTQHSTIKGQVGEKFTYQELNCRFPKAEIEDTHKQAGRGDFIMKEEDFTMLIETKNYKGNVKKPEIDKFYRDMETNHDVHCGILLSLKSGICSREDLQLEIVNGKPVLFLHNVSDNMDNIDLSVRIFKLILRTDSIDLGNKEVFDKIKNTIPIIKRYWNKMRQKVQKFGKDMLECLSEQEVMMGNIFQMLSFNY